MGNIASLVVKRQGRWLLEGDFSEEEKALNNDDVMY